MASFRKRSGKWQVQIRISGHTPISKTFHNKETARAWAIKQEQMILTKDLNPSEPHSIPLRHLFKRYSESVTPRKKSAVSELYRLSALSNTWLGVSEISGINSTVIAKFRDERLTQVSCSTVRRELNIVRHVFSVAASEWGYKSLKGIFEEVTIPKEPHHRIRRISKDELSAMWYFLAQQRNPAHLLIAQLALETGMRRSELLNLTFKDIQTDVIEIKTSKSGHPRLVPYTNEALRIIKQIEKGEPDDSIFDISINSLRLAWERARKKACITNLRFHDLRHEAISRMLEHGLSIAEVAAVSGHKDYKSLFRYSHMDVRKITKKLNTRN